jgi:hypothetical protein
LPRDPEAGRRTLGGLCAAHGLTGAERMLARSWEPAGKLPRTGAGTPQGG